jgi:hypothetical protein
MFSEEATTRTSDHPGLEHGVETSRSTRPDSGSVALWEMAVAAIT